MIGFYLHILTELPATIGFLFAPSATLAQPQPHASPVIRQYGVLLGVTSLLLVGVLADIENRAAIAPGDPLAEILRQRTAGALAIYHVAPSIRALGRLGVGFQLPCWISLGNNSEDEGVKKAEKGLVKAVFSSPLVHLILHGACCALLVDTAWGGNLWGLK